MAKPSLQPIYLLFYSYIFFFLTFSLVSSFNFSEMPFFFKKVQIHSYVKEIEAFCFFLIVIFYDSHCSPFPRISPLLIFALLMG